MTTGKKLCDKAAFDWMPRSHEGNVPGTLPAAVRMAECKAALVVYLTTNKLSIAKVKGYYRT